MFKKTLLVFLCLSLFLSITSCKKKLPTSPDIPDFKLPTIRYFTATPSQILWGESFVLAWQVTDENWHISNVYFSIIDNSGVLWFESTRIDNPWGPHAVEMFPHLLGEWTECTATTFMLTAKNDAGQVQKSCTLEVTPGFAEVVMVYGATGYSYLDAPRGIYVYDVRGGVKNIGSLPALNTKVSVGLYGSLGDLLASGDCLVGGDGFKLEPQQQAGWYIIFDDASGILHQQMDWDSEITYEITWGTAQGMRLTQTEIIPFKLK